MLLSIFNFFIEFTYLLCTVEIVNADTKEPLVLQNVLNSLSNVNNNPKGPTVVVVNVDKQDDDVDDKNDNEIVNAGPSAYWLDYLLRSEPELRSQSDQDRYEEAQLNRDLRSALRSQCNNMVKCTQLCPKPAPKKKKCKKTCKLIFDITVTICQKNQNQWGKTMPPKWRF